MKKLRDIFDRVSLRQFRQELQLDRAIEAGDCDKAAKVLDARTVAKISDRATTHFISAALNKRDGAMLRTLLDKGLKADVRDTMGNSALILASADGQPEAVRALIAKGADVNAKNHRGLSPILWAYLARRREVMKILVESGADTSDILKNRKPAAPKAA